MAYQTGIHRYELHVTRCWHCRSPLGQGVRLSAPSPDRLCRDCRPLYWRCIEDYDTTEAERLWSERRPHDQP